jgi:hypothetical protein
MRATVDEQVGRWQQNLAGGNYPDAKDADVDPEVKAGVGPHPRIGIGLPMSNIFATYFGGSLELVTLDGWGAYCSDRQFPPYQCAARHRCVSTPTKAGELTNSLN